MKILGINISHNPSVCLLQDGRVIKFYDEPRFLRNKHFNPTMFEREESVRYKCIDEKINCEVDKIIFASFGDFSFSIEMEYNISSLEYKRKLYSKNLDYATIKKFERQLKEKFSNISNYEYQVEHHLYHALCGYYFSNFDEALCIVMDAGGAQLNPEIMTYQEIESVYYINKKSIKPLHKHLSNARFERWQHAIPTMKNKSSHEYMEDGCRYVFSSEKSSGMRFTALTNHLKLADHHQEIGASAGKTMGLAAYGNPEGNRPEDLAHKLQLKTEKDTSDLIEYASKLTDCKNIVLSGGYSLNCLNNYKYVKRFPNLNFFADPCAHDGGTSIGSAVWLYRKLNGYA